MFNRLDWEKAKLLRQFAICSITILVVLINSIDQPIRASSIDDSLVGQLPPLTAPNEGQPLPAGFERRGTLEATGVNLDGRELFKIASPAVVNRSEPGSQVPIEVRAKEIEANLEQLVEGGGLSDDEVLDPNTFQLFIESLNGQPVLFVKDDALVESRVLLTVTDADAQYASIKQNRLAKQWKEILDRELRRALELRQPETLQRQISAVVKVLIATLLLTLLLGASWIFFGQQD